MIQRRGVAVEIQWLVDELAHSIVPEVLPVEDTQLRRDLSRHLLGCHMRDGANSRR